MAAQTTSAQWPLAARDDQLEAFEKLWALRSCHGAVVAGPPGVGKSRLAEECLARAVRAGFKGRRVTASRTAARMPLGAVAHLIPVGVDMSDPVRGFAQTARALAGPGRDRRWAVLVDDVQLLDAASAVLLRQLMDAGRVRLIGTLRTGETVSDAVTALGGQDAVGRIDLDAFDAGQTEAVLEAALGGPVGRITVHELYTVSGGNALYLHELVQGALGDGSLAFDGGIWQLAAGRAAGTPRLGELITSRLAGADLRGQDALDLLALCEPVPLADAEAAAGTPQIMVGLEETGLIQVRTERRRTLVSLAHPLYGETLRARIPALRHRGVLLAQIDRTKTHGGRRREDPLNIAAWQLAATGTADPALLAHAAALARYAHDYPQALALLEALDPETHTTATRIMLGEVLYEHGQPDRAEQVFQAADAEAAAEPEVLAVTMARCFNLYWSAARTQAALQVNDQARARIRSEQGRRILRYNEAFMRIHSGEPALGLELLGDLEEDIGDAANPVAWLFAAAARPVGLELLGRVGDAVTLAERVRAAHLKIVDNPLTPHPAASLTVLADVLLADGQLNRAREAAEQGFADTMAARVTMLPPIWLALHLGRIELLAGHVTTARRWFAEAVTRARTHHVRTPAHAALSGVATCAAILGDLEAAGQALTEAASHPPLEALLDLTYQAQGWLAAARDDLAEARSLLSEGAAQTRAMGMVSREIALLTDVARLGGADQAAQRLAELARICDGPLAQTCARLAAALAADDPDQLIATAQNLQAMGADLPAAELATAAACAYQRTGQDRKATAAAQSAHNCAARCEGARTPLLATATATAQLTAREHHIALLAAQGTPSKDIADALHLSVRTVENHLQRAYAKLGVTTRRELAHALGATPRRPAAARQT